jgi:hypothetical protein
MKRQKPFNARHWIENWYEKLLFKKEERLKTKEELRNEQKEYKTNKECPYKDECPYCENNPCESTDYCGFYKSHH